jgi:2'-5' RNA ligase
MTTHPALLAPDVMSQVQRLFFAVRPDVSAQAEMSSVGSQLCREHGLTGDAVAGDRLHVTLHWLQDHVELPSDLVERALVAGASVDAAPFDVVFDRAECIGSGGGLVVLTASRGTGSLQRFQRALAGAMADAGKVRYVRAGFRPHASLIYGDRQIDRQTVSPIRWTVNELVLIHSVVGRSRHIVLGRWPLQTRQLDRGW